MHKNWNELNHVLVHVIFHVIYFRQDRLKRNFGTLGIHTILLSSDAPPPSLLQKFKFLASSIVQASMPTSTDVMLSVCVFSAGHTHCWSASCGHSQRVNALEFWHARGPSRLALLAKDLICAPASQVCVERIFLSVGFSLLWTTKLYIQVSRWVCLNLNQIKCWMKLPVHNNRLSETWC